MPDGGNVRALDHLVLPVRELPVARARMEQLGFTVAADARHPFGTENACVFLRDGTYLEPLAVACHDDIRASVLNGNVFTARDHAFRFRNGDEGFSAAVLASGNAVADHALFRKAGISAGDMLEFSRPVKMPDGGESTAGFRLAFAADLRSPDFFIFACERTNALPADRGALETHANGVSGLSGFTMEEQAPADFAALLQDIFGQPDIRTNQSGFEFDAANSKISVLTPDGMSSNYGTEAIAGGRRLRGRVVTFRVADLAVTEALLAANGIAHHHRAKRLVVPPAPGQGAIFAFEEQSEA